MKGYIK